MKQTLTHTALFSGLFILMALPSESFGTTVSIAVQNISHHDVMIHCVLQTNTQFFTYPTDSDHTFTFHHGNDIRDEDPSIDIKQLNGLQSPFPNIICEEDPQNGFTYRLILPYDEEVNAYGHFEYDSSYSGSVIYRD